MLESSDIQMSHLICRVSSFKIVGPYTLKIGFDDNTEQLIDFQPVLAGELYSPLRSVELFKQVQIDSETGTLVWPNGADFDSATLHDWPVYKQAFLELTARWEPVPF